MKWVHLHNESMVTESNGEECTLASHCATTIKLLKYNYTTSQSEVHDRGLDWCSTAVRTRVMQRSATSDWLAAHISLSITQCTFTARCAMCYRCVYRCVYRCREEPPRLGQAAADTAVSPFPPAAAGTLFHVCRNGHTCKYMYTCAAGWSHSHTGLPIKKVSLVHRVELHIWTS